jgi:hypothetical protein
MIMTRVPALAGTLLAKQTVPHLWTAIQRKAGHRPVEGPFGLRAPLDDVAGCQSRQTTNLHDEKKEKTRMLFTKRPGGHHKLGCSLIAIFALVSIAVEPNTAQADRFCLSAPLAFSNGDGCLTSIDARSYRHCHYIMTRVYCHKSDRLPRVWPPFSDTPKRDKSSEDSQSVRPRLLLDQIASSCRWFEIDGRRSARSPRLPVMDHFE